MYMCKNSVSCINKYVIKTTFTLFYVLKVWYISLVPFHVIILLLFFLISEHKPNFLACYYCKYDDKFLYVPMFVTYAVDIL